MAQTMSQPQIDIFFSAGSGSNTLPTRVADPIRKFRNRLISDTINGREIMVSGKVISDEKQYGRAFAALLNSKDSRVLEELRQCQGFGEFREEIDARMRKRDETSRNVLEVTNGLNSYNGEKRIRKLEEIRDYLVQKEGYESLKDIAHEFSVAGLHAGDFILLYKDERPTESIATALQKGGYSEDEIMRGFSKTGFGAEVEVKVAEILHPKFEEMPSLTELTKKIYLIREAIECLLDSGETLPAALSAVITVEREKGKDGATDAQIACALAIQDARFKIGAKEAVQALQSAGIHLDAGFTEQIGRLKTIIKRHEITLLHAELKTENGK